MPAPLTDMSSSLFFAYPQIAVIPNSGILGLTAYAFATVVPLWAFALLGPFMRRVCPEGFTMAQFVRVRFGWPVGVLLAVIVSLPLASHCLPCLTAWPCSSAASCCAS